MIGPAAGTVRRTRLDDLRAELPRVDDRTIGTVHRHIAVAADSGRVDGLLPGEYDALCWYDTRAADVRGSTWNAGDLCVGEPVFTPVPGSLDGDEGYWLTYATDRGDGTSLLLVLPAADPAQGPVAQVRIPVRVPLGLHGSRLPTEE